MSTRKYQCAFSVLMLVLPLIPARSQVISRQAHSTLTAVEMDHGETLSFQLANGQTRTMRLDSTGDVSILLTNINLPNQQWGGGTIYEFSCHVTIDGHPMTMRRYIPVQQSFYEPYVVNGMRIWFDGTKKIGDSGYFVLDHGTCVPRKAARFAVQDATLPICPLDKLSKWVEPNDKNYIDIRDCYSGDDCWMGPYFGAGLHGGLDINHPCHTPLYAPVPITDHFLFNSLAAGDNNNRWRGFSHWDNGDVWTLQAHHLQSLVVNENTPLEAGTEYADAACVRIGEHAHSHFVFKVTHTPGDTILLDPWIVFWQVFEKNKQSDGEIKAHIAPVSPATTGQAVSFSSSGSRSGQGSSSLSYFWAFGEGGFSNEQHPSYTYAKPGVHPVTLVVSDTQNRASFTQHITVDGAASASPGLALHAPEELSFRTRPVEVMDTYGRPIVRTPHTLEFLARPASRPSPSPKIVHLVNTGAGTLPAATVDIEYAEGSGWIVASLSGSGNDQRLSVTVDASNLAARTAPYEADIRVECPGSANTPQVCHVALTSVSGTAEPGMTVDNLDSAHFYATPWFWVAPRFRKGDFWPKTNEEIYVTNGHQRDREGEFVRFTPDLVAGTYAVSFMVRTKFYPTVQQTDSVGFYVRIRHKNGIDTVWVDPLASLTIGTYEFDEGADGYVELLAGGSKGMVVADAVMFQPSQDSKSDIVIDNSHPSGVTIVGEWKASATTSGYRGEDYLHDDNTGKGSKSVTYTPHIQAEAEYTVYLQWTSYSNRASNVPVIITHADGVDTVQVDQTTQGGAWVELGTYSFQEGTGNNVRIVNANTSGYVIADAVWFHQVTPSVTGQLSQTSYIPTSLAVQHAAKNRIVYLEFSTSHNQSIVCDVYSARGKHIAQVASGLLGPGRHRVAWDTHALSSGVYFMRTRLGGRIATASISLTR